MSHSSDPSPSSPDSASPSEERDALPGRAHRHRFEGPFFRRLMLGGIRHLPPEVKRLSMPLWAGIFYALLPQARRAVEKNLSRVLSDGQPDALSSRLQAHLRFRKKCFELFVNYAQMLADSYSLLLGIPIGYKPTTVGLENMVGAVRGGKGVIAATGHLGMWQIAPSLAQLRGLARFCLAMAEEPNRRVQAFEKQFRDRFEIIYTTESPFASLRLAQVLREGAMLGMQIDRNIGGQVVDVPFFGVPVAFPAGPAMLARITGAPIVPHFFVIDEHDGERKVVHYIEPPIVVSHSRERARDIHDATVALVGVYERFVRRYPTQWYHFYDFFSARPSSHSAATAVEPRRS
ncbi:MAG: lysophospholipid acyltransferase family protein [Myxococcales bacterium]|nr:lysophospholipid acyltransferase family protein [Myxococcales bacterium]